MGGDTSNIVDPLRIIPQKGTASRIFDPLQIAQRPKKNDPAPLPDLPTREDPAILEAREKLRLSEQRRRGRAATNLTAGFGATGVNRPVAQTAKLLGE